ncbi:uncharacterized protein LOC131536777 isoform X4 [Onychostoma macrolepis]|uniref:uncharacterized protein LOC131536777 isoform X4 n=1 Tax=Onychostoma macrolepis TaxID=369639 RepID=UPI00272A0FF6|nr:uncharacterized protein LOC131536777 isoform X4 [Onychostoma macrolepis]
MYLSRAKKRTIAVALLVIRRKRAARKKRLWVHETLRSREQFGEFRLAKELRSHSDRFQVYFRLSREQFDSLLSRVGPRISRIHTNYREPVSSMERLAICLRYLATGDSYTTIASSYRVGISTVAGIVPDVSKAIWDSLVDEFLPVPETADWQEIALGFKERWNFPNCVDAMDGKHVVIQAPHNSGSQYFNYKGTYSVVLLAVVDARYLFRVVDVGAFGRNSDGETLAASAFGQALWEEKLHLPVVDRLRAAQAIEINGFHSAAQCIPRPV